MTLAWQTESPTPFFTDRVFQIEQAAASYYARLLAEEPPSSLQDNVVVRTAVSARKQNVGNSTTVLETEVSVINVARACVPFVAGLDEAVGSLPL